MTDLSRPRRLDTMLEAALWRSTGQTLDAVRPRVLVLVAGGHAHPALPAMVSACLQGIAAAGGLGIELAVNSGQAPGLGGKAAWKSESLAANQAWQLCRTWKPSAVAICAGDEAGLVACLRGVARADLPAVAVPAPGSPWDPQWRNLLDHGAAVEQSRQSLEAWLAELETAVTGDLGGAWRFPSAFRYLLEPLGLAPWGAGAADGVSGAADAARRGGWESVRLANAGVKLSQVLVAANLKNALAVNASLGGGPSAAWRLLQVAGEQGAAVKAGWLFSGATKDFCGPAGELRDPAAFRADGGVAGLMLSMLEEGQLDGAARDLSRRRLRDSLPETLQPDQPRFFKTAAGSSPVRRDWLLRGSLAPLGMIANGPAAGGSVSLPAKVVSGEAAALDLYRKQALRSSEVLVIRAQGQRLPLVQAARRSNRQEHWLLTDGLVDADAGLDTAFRLPSQGGAWASLKDGDLVRLDLEAGSADTDAVAGIDQPGAASVKPAWAGELEKLRSFGFS